MTLRRTFLASLAASAALGFFSTGPAMAQAEGDPPVVPIPVDAAVPAPPATTVRAVQIEGARSVPDRDLRGAVDAVIIGKPGDREAIDRAVDAVVALYRQRGFSVAQVIGTELSDDGVLRLTVAEGTVRQIVLRGNGKTRSATILSVLSTRPGSVYQESRVQKDRDLLARLGIFDDVTVRPVPAGAADLAPDSDEDENRDEEDGATKSEPGDAGETASNPATVIPEALILSEDQVGLVDLVVRVRERKTGNVAAAVGFADSTGLVGYVDVSEDNLGGTAHRIAGQWQRSTRVELSQDGREFINAGSRMAYRVSYAAPPLGARGIAFGAELYDQNTIFLPFFSSNEETLRQYEQRRGGSVRVGRALRPGYSLFVSARRDEVGYDPVPLRLNPPLGALLSSAGTVAALGAELIGDSRDAADNPRRGYRWSVAHERAGRLIGGSRVFNQTVVDLRQYAPLGPTGKNGPLVLAMRLLGGTSGGDVPLSEQFWIGGFDLLRGYNLFSIRGDRMLLTSVEARIPLGQGVQGVLFTDYGNAWTPGTRAALGDMRAGIGAGLRFLTPFGPIRLDAAYGDGLKTYVSLGQAY